MISKMTLENFFSFRHPTTIELNPDINILVGINGSGKSNFLKAIHLLAESISGNGLESVFLKEWSGFNAVINFNQPEKDAIKLSFEFDKNVINNVMQKRGYQFPNNPIYEINIVQAGTTSYYLTEKLYSKPLKPDEKDVIYMKMNNAQGIISTRESGKARRFSFACELQLQHLKVIINVGLTEVSPTYVRQHPIIAFSLLDFPKSVQPTSYHFSSYSFCSFKWACSSVNLNTR